MKLSNRTRFSKGKISIAMGAGTGIAAGFIAREFLDSYGIVIPYIPMPFNRISTGGLMIGGAVILGLSQMTKIFGSGPLKSFTSMFAFSSIVFGLFNGIFPAPSLNIARARGNIRPIRRAPYRTVAPRRATAPQRAGPALGLTPTAINYKRVLA